MKYLQILIIALILVVAGCNKSGDFSNTIIVKSAELGNRAGLITTVNGSQYLITYTTTWKYNHAQSAFKEGNTVFVEFRFVDNHIGIFPLITSYSVVNDFGKAIKRDVEKQINIHNYIQDSATVNINIDNQK